MRKVTTEACFVYLCGRQKEKPALLHSGALTLLSVPFEKEKKTSSHPEYAIALRLKQLVKSTGGKSKDKYRSWKIIFKIFTLIWLYHK